MYKSVLEFPLSTAEDLINALLLKGKVFNQHTIIGTPDTVFRGERTLSFNLLPSALRSSQIWIDISGKIQEPRFDGFNAIECEALVLYDFYKIAGKNGIHLPEIKFFHEYEKQNLSFDYIFALSKWLDKDLFEIAGIAQHYGIPTRLLDWSYNPATAIYFAAMGAVDHFYKASIDSENKEVTTGIALHKEDKMVVWALDKTSIIYEKDGRIPIPIEFIQPPYHRNPNLTAQEGLFTHWYFDQHQEPGFDNSKPLDQAINDYTFENPVLHKYTLPLNQANRLLKLLENFRFTASRIFPGLVGVAKEVEDKKKREFVSKFWPVE